MEVMHWQRRNWRPAGWNLKTTRFCHSATLVPVSWLRRPTSRKEVKGGCGRFSIFLTNDSAAC